MKLQRERVSEIAEKLKAMPPSSASAQISKQAAITELAGEIRQLQMRGYTVGDIAKALSDEGLAIAPATLKNYMQRSRSNATRKHVGRRMVATAGAAVNAVRNPRPTQQATPAQLAPAIPAQQAESKGATFAPTEDSKDI